MKRDIVSFGLVAFVLFISVPVSHADGLAKHGSFAAVFGWTVTSGQTVQVDAGHLLWGGVATGSLRNESGDGFLHAAAAACTFSGEFHKDAVTHNGGDCVATDRDGDKVTMAWKCTTCPTSGDFYWTGGSGKYNGIKGRGRFIQTDAGPQGGNSGWSVWKGDWELP